VELSSATFNVAETLEVCVDLVWPLACSKSIAVACSIQPLVRRCLVRGDELRLRQILVHLLNNAAKFTDSGTIEVVVCAEELSSPFKLALQVKVP
jgi:signal transduction histidine kinase